MSSRAMLRALDCSLAIIEFSPDGMILTANKNFCNVVGYELSEIKGRHHSMFVEPHAVAEPAYKDFWAKLGRGEFDMQEYKRIGKGGREVWIQASYNPVKSANGKVLKVVKVATDITLEKLRNAELSGTVDAISRAQAVIEFTTDGDIITANENFLQALGYSLDEIKGKHHRMFVDAEYGRSAEYADFWRQLNGGAYVSAEFKRIGKGGREVWIQASYNPIFDMNGKVFKVTKFATNVTDRVKAVHEIGKGLRMLAEHNLDYRITTAVNADFEQLRTDFNNASEGLQSVMVRIGGSTGVIETGTKEIAEAANDLLHRTEQQAASLEETVAALDEITATVKQSAEGASHAREVVATTDKNARESAVVMRRAVQAMDSLSKSSGQIGQIIGVIDEIAFQTNLLALNAGVEAARAGDAGRGFAVVASEVRALAQRSAEAAKEIKGLISASATQVDQGVELVMQTGKSLDQIMEQVTQITEVITRMALGAKEQAIGLDEINAAMNQMDQVTQQNAAMVERSTAAGNSLAEESVRLAGLVGQFDLGAPSAPVRLEATPKRPRRATPVDDARQAVPFQRAQKRA